MLLIDQNLSRRLVSLLSPRFAGCSHVQLLGLEESPDQKVWESAALAGLAILTKDSDFQDMAIARGFPPKVVLLSIGNCTTSDVADLVLASAELIEAFLAGADSILILGR